MNPRIIGAVVRSAGISTVVYAVWDAVFIARGQHLTHEGQLGWLAIAGLWAAWGVVTIWPSRRW